MRSSRAEARPLGSSDLRDCLGRGIAPDSGDHREMLAGDVAGGGAELKALGRAQRRAFARRGSDHDAIGALRDLPVNEAFQRAMVDRVLVERRDQRGEHAMKPVVHDTAQSSRSVFAVMRTARGLWPVSNAA